MLRVEFPNRAGLEKYLSMVDEENVMDGIMSQSNGRHHAFVMGG